MTVKKTLQPLYDRLLLEQVIPGEGKENTFKIPKDVQGKLLTRARVLAVGKGKFNTTDNTWLPSQVQVGDIVFVNPMLGMQVKPEREETYVVVLNGEEVQLSHKKKYLIQKEDELLMFEVLMQSDSGE